MHHRLVERRTPIICGHQHPYGYLNQRYIGEDILDRTRLGTALEAVFLPTKILSSLSVYSCYSYSLKQILQRS